MALTVVRPEVAAPSGRSMIMDDTLGLLEESRQLARELGYDVREEPLGDVPGGPCVIAGRQVILLNVAQSAAGRLDVLLRAICSDPAVAGRPVSRLLASRLAAARDA